ncbi:MaoC family dehydratase N-terminal domain-containing protein [Lipingzhangella sp. LS1_29]|uniref:MaoC family dehydratase N-terminal domain-containing protein n=1 Tax=Lipingzhangella rawalii TaxID=2055835 RepID=A0ABU2HBD8_9ACTN|nr:MaoC family dehydratase N-terminal domain-containing protein [Lipingzhangella rawalii]MDS1272650.1 MaoC family dehydratase N-terminal domain-containing protein [Lipingzhangella rawalii]
MATAQTGSNSHPAPGSPPALADALTGWDPAPVRRSEVIAAEPAQALAGVLDQPPPVREEGDALPALWHWLHFLDRPAESELGADGHPSQGHFYPPIARRVRMFAGGRMTVTAPVRVGEHVTRDSRITDWRIKQGRRGELLFVTVEHRLSVAGEPRVVEEQDLVYRQAEEGDPPPAGPSTGHPPPAQANSSEFWLTPSSTLLFRFSALTYNAHRIHYDHPYATGVEGYPDLVVHGPLLALALLELPRRAGHAVRAFRFRLRSPCYVGRAVLLRQTPGGDAGTVELTALSGADAAVTAQAEIQASDRAHR